MPREAEHGRAGESGALADGEFERRRREELERYRDCWQVHDLPAIHSFWSRRVVLPKLQACGFAGIAELYLHFITEACRRRPERLHRLISLGAGNCDLELQLAAECLARDVDNLQIECLELNPEMLGRGRAAAESAGLASMVRFEERDLERWREREPVTIVLANHSLHHLVDLEGLLDSVRASLEPDGVFLVNDMIGRNGHLRWPEARVHVEAIWSVLPRRYKFNRQLQRIEDEFADWDCSVEGNEGIRAQEVLPLLIERFAFDTFVAFGNLANVFVDRAFGPNFDVANPVDTAWVERIADLDEQLMDRGHLTPTQMIGALRANPGSPARCYRHWTPHFCVRRIDG